MRHICFARYLYHSHTTCNDATGRLRCTKIAAIRVHRGRSLHWDAASNGFAPDHLQIIWTHSVVNVIFDSRNSLKLNEDYFLSKFIWCDVTPISISNQSVSHTHTQEKGQIKWIKVEIRMNLMSICVINEFDLFNYRHSVRLRDLCA